MDDLPAFLAARLDEDEPVARAFKGWNLPNHGINPGRLFREVQAKRAILARYERALTVPPALVSFTRGQDDGYIQACRDAMADLAAVYSDHPGYRPEWKP